MRLGLPCVTRLTAFRRDDDAAFLTFLYRTLLYVGPRSYTCNSSNSLATTVVAFVETEEPIVLAAVSSEISASGWLSAPFHEVISGT
jgi:hypothetical protein